MAATPDDPARPDIPRVQKAPHWADPEPATSESPLELAPTRPAARPSPRLIRSPQDAEGAAAEWLRWLGFTDASVTKAGADGGVDVRGRSLVAQVKAHMVPISRPDLQRLYGVAQHERAASVFFSLMSYTRDAHEWAEQVGMALFRFNHAGEPQAVNSYAEALVRRAEQEACRPDTRPTRSEVGLSIGCSDDDAYQALAPRRARFRQTEQLMWVRHGWLPFVSLRYDYTYLALRGRRWEELFGHNFAAFELFSGTSIAVPPDGSTVWLPSNQAGMIQPRTSSTDLARKLQEIWAWFSGLRQPAAIERGRATLAAWGVPPAARTLRVSTVGTYFLPYFAALITGSTGNRVATLEAVTGTPDPGLSALFTRSAPFLLDELFAGRPISAGDHLGSN